MPLDRRRFLLAAGGTAAALPFANPLHAAGAGRTVAVVERGVPESLLFADGLMPLVCRLDDPQGFAAALAQRLHAGLAVVGLTREAATFVTGEMLRGSGFRLLRAAHHRDLLRTTQRHVVDDALLREAALFSAGDWPRKVARALSMGAPRPLPHAVAVTGHARPLPPSPGSMVSWRIVAAT